MILSYSDFYKLNIYSIYQDYTERKDVKLRLVTGQQYHHKKDACSSAIQKFINRNTHYIIVAASFHVLLISICVSLPVLMCVLPVSYMNIVGIIIVTYSLFALECTLYSV